MFFGTLKDKLFRSLDDSETLSLEQSVSMLGSSCFKDVNVVRCDFQDIDGLKGDPIAFVTKYFTPEDSYYSSTVEHQIFKPRSGKVLHRLHLNYSVKEMRCETVNLGFASFIYLNPCASRCYPSFGSRRKATIEFYSEESR